MVSAASFQARPREVIGICSLEPPGLLVPFFHATNPLQLHMQHPFQQTMLTRAGFASLTCQLSPIPGVSTERKSGTTNGPLVFDKCWDENMCLGNSFLGYQ